MIDKMLFLKANKIGLGLAVVFLATLSGCMGNAHGPRAGARVDAAVFVDQDDYYYYPDYACYYSVNRHQYFYRDGRYWVSRPAPHGVSVDVFMRSPRVFMTFHDSPANHHDAVVKQYPKYWKESGPQQVQKRDDRKARKDRKDNHGR